ncbi:MAG: DUF3750 domain-containing protein [Proteobacteria bacterium]|nr:DUF3750 domain-containing protein [Pseudomonadota bacterium]
MRRTRKVVLSVFALAVVLALVVGRAVVAQDWRTASREPVGLAPAAARTPEAVVQVYGARTVGMRGLFGVHTWVAVKPENADAYTVYEVIGWRLRWSGSAVSTGRRHADGRWFGAEPELYADKRGAEAAALIPRIEAAAHSYPYAKEYSAWPGPNSNTFVAWITRAVPELGAHLPPTAIGKDYLGDSVVGSAPSGRGFQVSLGGVFAFTASAVEGLEMNVLGLTFGFDPLRPALKLPMIGRIGVSPH